MKEASLIDLVFFATQVPDTSDTSANTSRNKSATRATQAQHK